MKIKQGISLIVLVITIIVMTILAGAIILSLNNSGIIEKATKAVEETNLATIKELTQMAWAEAYVDGARTEQELKAAVDNVLAQNKITEDMYEGYTIKVTTTGVSLDKIEYVDFELNNTNLYKLGVIVTRNEEDEYNPDAWPEDIKELIIPETFYDEQDGVWYKVTRVEIIYTGLKKMVIPDSVTDIYLEGNWYLENVNIPRGVTKIVEETFTECFSIKELIISDSVTVIEKRAFRDMYANCHMIISNAVVKIGEGAFSWTDVTEITYLGTKAEWQAIDFGDRWFVDAEERNLTIHCTDGDIIVESQ